jgi:hypothetical protein
MRRPAVRRFGTRAHQWAAHVRQLAMSALSRTLMKSTRAPRAGNSRRDSLNLLTSDDGQRDDRGLERCSGLARELSEAHSGLQKSIVLRRRLLHRRMECKLLESRPCTLCFHALRALAVAYALGC